MNLILNSRITTLQIYLYMNFLNLIFKFIATIGFVSTSAISAESCFRDHLHEAIALNTQRRPMYSQLSGGKSEIISNQLIRMEKTSLLLTYLPMNNFDSKLADFKKYNVDVTCDAFVSMKTVTAFNSIFLTGLPNADATTVHSDLIISEIEGFLHTQDTVLLKNVLLNIIKGLKVEPRLNCMTTHVLDSMARIASLYPHWVSQITSKDDQIKFKKIISSLLTNHLRSIKYTALLDQKARPLQLAGLPIICQDVPVIQYEQ